MKDRRVSALHIMLLRTLSPLELRTGGRATVISPSNVRHPRAIRTRRSYLNAAVSTSSSTRSSARRCVTLRRLSRQPTRTISPGRMLSEFWGLEGTRLRRPPASEGDVLPPFAHRGLGGTQLERAALGEHLDAGQGLNSACARAKAKNKEQKSDSCAT